MHPNDNAASNLPQIIAITDKSIKDITGQRFGRLVALGYVGIRSRAAHWLCRCDCGQHTVSSGNSLRMGHSRSCGCLQSEKTANRNRSHGMRHTPEYGIWSSIIDRCENPNQSRYARYGGRGITMCDQWRNSFEQFMADMGPRPSRRHTVERIDNDLGYCPENCRWATYTEQANNKSTNRILEFRGERLTIAEWSRKTGITVSALEHRIERGWDIERILTAPVTTNADRQNYFEFQGERLTLNEWSVRTGIRKDTLRHRIKKGWPMEKVLTRHVGRW